DFDMETIMDNYLLTNKYMTKYVAAAQLGVFLKTFRVKYAKRIKMLFVVTRSCLESFIRAAEETYGSFDLFIKNGLGIDDNTKAAFKAKSLK
ncbi:MAG: tyrosine-protein phosphatase, partial [Clostridia bacterium]|nr:tyrosine-protein phosphatase [Clostridia bacterium]